MRFILLILSTLFSLFAFPQVPDPADVTEDDIPPEMVPSEHTLRSFGASDEEVDAAMQYKDGEKSFDEIKSEYVDGEEGDQQSTTTEKDVSTQEDVSEDVTTFERPSWPRSNVYGHNFFRQTDLRIYEGVNEMKAPLNYVLGVGDEVSIAFWGYSEYNGVFTIASDGYIDPKETGRIYLQGLTLEEAKEVIRKKFGSYLDANNSKYAVNLTYSRAIMVNIVGEVFQPGSYQISAVNHAFSALVASGGPSDFGSVRDILIKRDGKTIQELDVYDYLQNPQSGMEFYLQNNDYIFVPSAERTVFVAGEIKRPMGYQLKEEESMDDLLKYSGGLKPTAYTKTIQVKRFENNRQVLIDVAYDSLQRAGGNFKLNDGDSIFVFKIPTGIQTFVTIKGDVVIPGKYDFIAGQTVSDVLTKAEGILPTALLARAYVIRTNFDLSKEYLAFDLNSVITSPGGTDDIELQNADEILIFSKLDFTDEYYVEIFGSVRKEGSFIYGNNMTLKDVLVLSGGLKKEAANNRIEISRIINFDESVEQALPTRTIIEIVEIGYDLRIDQGSENFVLQPFDQIFIRETPDFQPQMNVVVSGEVLYPGQYSMQTKNDRITDIIHRAGGFTDEAYLPGIKIYPCGK